MESTGAATASVNFTVMGVVTSVLESAPAIVADVPFTAVFSTDAVTVVVPDAGAVWLPRFQVIIVAVSVFAVVEVPEAVVSASGFGSVAVSTTLVAEVPITVQLNVYVRFVIPGCNVGVPPFSRSVKTGASAYTGAESCALHGVTETVLAKRMAMMAKVRTGAENLRFLGSKLMCMVFFV